MSRESVDLPGREPVSPDALLAAAAAAGDPRGRVAFATLDLFQPDETRIDEHVRAVFATTLRTTVDAIASDLLAHAGRSLEAGGEADAATALTEGPPPFDILAERGLLAEAELVGELLARIEIDTIADRLPGAAADDPDRPSVLAAMAEHGDRVIAQAARALIAADARSRDAMQGLGVAPMLLSAQVQHRLTWRIAAVLRQRARRIDNLAAVDVALCDAVRRSLRAYDEGERIDIASARLAAALDPARGELGRLLVEVLDDRRLSFFVTLVARGLGSDRAAIAALVLDRAGDGLWLALRALGLDRSEIARIGFLLSEADARRSLERFVDRIDAVMAIDPARAEAALSLLRADEVYRDAVSTLGRWVSA